MPSFSEGLAKWKNLASLIQKHYFPLICESENLMHGEIILYPFLEALYPADFKNHSKPEFDSKIRIVD